jgi:hypothetical protein
MVSFMMGKVCKEGLERVTTIIQQVGEHGDCVLPVSTDCARDDAAVVGLVSNC